MFDDFVESPTSALRFISLSLRRTISTPRDTRLARLEFGTFYKVVCKSTFYEPIMFVLKKIAAFPIKDRTIISSLFFISVQVYNGHGKFRRKATRMVG